MRIRPTQWGIANTRDPAIKISLAFHAVLAAHATAQGCTLRDALEAAITRALDASLAPRKRHSTQPPTLWR